MWIARTAHAHVWNTFKNRITFFKQSITIFAEQILQYQNKKDDESHETYLDYVLDITIAYPDGEPIDLPDIATGIREPCQTYFLYRLYHSSEVMCHRCESTKMFISTM